VETKKFYRKKPSQKLKPFLYFYKLAKRKPQNQKKNISEEEKSELALTLYVQVINSPLLSNP